MRRFYATNNGSNRGNLGDAWPRGHAAELWSLADAMGLQRVANGTPRATLPQPDDILVFDGVTTQTAGHVAIVVSADDTAVVVFEQNWSSSGYATLAARVQDDGSYVVAPRSGFAVKGWMGLRRADDAQKLP